MTKIKKYSNRELNFISKKDSKGKYINSIDELVKRLKRSKMALIKKRERLEEMKDSETITYTIPKKIVDKRIKDLKKQGYTKVKNFSANFIYAPKIEDSVNHPSYYASGKIEVIDFIEDQKLGFNLGNSVKYISRAGKKDPAKLIEDLKKAQWYLNREISNLEKPVLTTISSK